MKIANFILHYQIFIADIFKYIDGLFEKFQKTSIGGFLLRKKHKNYYTIILIFGLIISVQLSTHFFNFFDAEQKVENHLASSQGIEYIFWLFISFIVPTENIYLLVFSVVVIIIVTIIKFLELKKSPDSFYELSGDGDSELNFKVVEALINGDYIKAEQYAREYLKKYPKSIRAKYNLSIALANQDDTSKLSEAKEYFESIANDKNLVALLKLHEDIDNPVNFILNDPGLEKLFMQFPILKHKIQLLQNSFAEKMGVKNYGGGCFPSGTPIALPQKKFRSIQNLKIGDKVLSYNENTSVFSTSTVVRIGETISSTILINRKYHVSVSQPLYTNNGWVIAEKLCNGDKLFTLHNKVVVIDTLEHLSIQQKVYWIEVEPDHTYFANTILAHNKLN